ncbi:MAG: energy transducer TonB [Verrucomicrobia bacterium]|nr:energy transducer TonB [Verrucomicrobiota bacterium]MBU1910753.1 energy transducer TonB [Verrucomicrobiota bacterium]
MSSSPRSLNNRRDRPDHADRTSSAVGLAIVLAGWAWLMGRDSIGPRPGEVRLFPETVLRLALAPVSAVATPPPPPSPEPEPEPPPEPAPEPDDTLALAPPEPEPEIVESLLEPAPALAEQPPMENEREAGRADALRVEWISELRRRIEENKFYPGAARYSEESGTVTLRVQISPSAEIERVEILENTGSALLAAGARAILRRAAATPLGTNRLPEGMQVQVPITYRMTGRAR